MPSTIVRAEILVFLICAAAIVGWKLLTGEINTSGLFDTKSGSGNSPARMQMLLATLAGAGWYLGLVGDMPRVQVVAYESALMFDPVKDVLTIPSYCRDVPFYWTQKPAGA